MSPHSPNFLTCPIEPEPPKNTQDSLPKVPRPFFRLRRWGAVFVCVILLVIIVPPALALTRAALFGRAAQASLMQARTDLLAMNTADGVAHLTQAHEELALAQHQFAKMGFWRTVPWVGTQLHALEDGVRVASQALDGLEDVVGAIQGILEAAQIGPDISAGLDVHISPARRLQDLSREDKRTALAKLSDALPRLRLAREKIDLAVELWNRLPRDQVFGPVRAALQPLANELPRLKRTIDEVIPLLDGGIPLLGYPAPIRFLVLLQNADEIRPGGGFIGNVGTVTMDAGEVKEFDFTDVYTIDNPVSRTWKENAPEPITTQLGVPAWFLRDANWSPDIPQSAERALDFYLREQELATGKPVPQPPSAVVVLEPGLFRALFELIGPIEVQGKLYTASNFFDSLQYEVEQGFLIHGKSIDERKQLVEHVGGALMSQLFLLPASRWSDALHILTRGLHEKQVMLYSRDPQMLSVLDANGWTGRTKPTRGDFVWVIDANLAALKTDGVMNKKIVYQLDASHPDQLHANVTLTYTNTNRQIDWRYTRYRSYTRVYVPEGSQLEDVQVSGASGGSKIDVTKELGKSVFGTFWTIEPGKTGTLSFRYRLPVGLSQLMVNGGYVLDWPKQVGADETSYVVDLNFDKKVGAARPAEDSTHWGDARYTVQADSKEDRSFFVQLR